MSLEIYVDGGARGNPGPAGAGVAIFAESGAPLFEAAYYLGEQTNNVAEYNALIRALQRVVELEPQSITIYSDSELMVRQVTGAYRVKNARLAQLHGEVQLLLLKVMRWSLRHIDREENARADELANMAMDRRRDVVVTDKIGGDGAAGSAADALAEEDGPAPGKGADIAVSAVEQRSDQAVQVTLSRAPGAGNCPAGGVPEEPFVVQHTLPPGLCVHAAHALLPTLLAILNTDPQEFAGIPTLTVRCNRPGCRAEFKLAPVHSSNGSGRSRG